MNYLETKIVKYNMGFCHIHKKIPVPVIVREQVLFICMPMALNFLVVFLHLSHLGGY